MDKKYNSKNYVILLNDFSLEDEQHANKIFQQLKSSPVSIIGLNGGSDNWHFIICFRQPDDLNHSKEIEEIMSPVLVQYNLKIKKVWEE